MSYCDIPEVRKLSVWPQGVVVRKASVRCMVTVEDINSGAIAGERSVRYKKTLTRRILRSSRKIQNLTKKEKKSVWKRRHGLV